MKLIVDLSLLVGSVAFSSPPTLTQRSSLFRLHSTAAQTDVGHLEVDAENASEGFRSERVSLDISKTIYTSSIKTPKDSYIAFAEKGAANAKMPKTKILHQSILGGCYVGFGGLLALSVAGGLGGIGAANPGIPKMAFAALFPVNLLLIVTTGGQLFTGNSSAVAGTSH